MLLRGKWLNDSLIDWPYEAGSNNLFLFWVNQNLARISCQQKQCQKQGLDINVIPSNGDKQHEDQITNGAKGKCRYGIGFAAISVQKYQGPNKTY